MPLVRIADFENFPSEPIARWLSLRELKEVRLDEGIDYQNGPATSDLLEYVEVLSASASQLGLQGLPDISPSNVLEEFDHFRAKVAALAPKILMEKSGPLVSSTSLVLSQPVRDLVLSEVEKLESLVEESGYDQAKKATLKSLLRELRNEVDRDAVDYARLMRALCFCAAGLGGTTAFLADAPAAFATISQLIGLQTEANEAKTKQIRLPEEPAVPQLPSPPKQLPSPSQ